MSVPAPVLIFRPEDDAARTALAVADAGFLPVPAPLFTIEPAAEPCPSGPFDAILLTSANAAARLDLDRTTPVLTVGRRTAEAARAAGFADARPAAGDRKALTALVRETLPGGARLLAALGEDRREDWLADLRRDGYDVTLWTAYAAKAATRLPDIARAALSGQPRPVALHFSARGAKIFLDLADEAGLGEAARAIRHVVMSEEAAVPLRAAGASRIDLAATPDQPGLIATLAGAATTAPLDTAPHKSDNAPASATGASGQESIGVTTDVDDKPANAAAEGRKTPRAVPVIEAEAVEVGAPEAARPEAVADPAPAPQPAAVAATLPARRGFGWGGLLLAGVVGGLVGATALHLLQARLGPTLGVLPAALVTPPGGGTSAATAALEKRLAAAETAIAAAAPRSALQALETRAGEAAELAKTAQAAAEKAARTPAAAPAQAAAAAAAAAPASPVPEAGLAALSDRVAKVETKAGESADTLAKALPRLAAAETAARTAGVQSQLSGVSAKLLLVERTRAAITAGRPFADEIRGLEAAGVPAETLAPLAAVAAKGAATRDALREELRKHRRAMAEENAARPSDWKDRALALAGRVVSVQRVDGGDGGDSPAALVSRLESSVEAGDFAAASAAWAKLPEPARRASETLGASLSARSKAEAALKAVADAAVAALTAR